MVYRRYGYLQSRILLEKQDELRLLEEQLDAIDKSEMHKRPHKLFGRKHQGEERKGLLAQIEVTFCEYGTVIPGNFVGQADNLKRRFSTLHNK